MSQGLIVFILSSLVRPLPAPCQPLLWAAIWTSSSVGCARRAEPLRGSPVSEERWAGLTSQQLGSLERSGAPGAGPHGEQ